MVINAWYWSWSVSVFAIVWLLGGALEGVGLSSGNMGGVSTLSEYCISGVKLSLPGERSGVSSESTVLGGALEGVRLQAGSEDVCSGNMGGVSSKSSMSECRKSGVSLSLSGERC